MAKSLNDVLKRYTDAISGKLPASSISALTTGDNPGVDYADKMKDTRDFLAMHTVEKHADRNGNGDDVFKASKVNKAKMERHGHEPKPKDIKVYNKTQQIGDPENKLKEEAENDDGWYAHKEMHGSKAVSEEEWKKGWRLNSKGEKVKKTSGIKEAKDNREYDYEGEMAVTKLKTIVRAAEHLIKMMEPNTNLPEWVQSKIIKAEDYITTAHDYLMSEMNEEVEDLEEGGSQYRSAAGSGKNTNPNLSRLARKLSFEKPKSYRPPGTPSKAESKAFLDAEVAKFMKKGGKIRKEEVEELDETSPSNKPKKNRAAQKVGLAAAKAGHPDFNTKIRADVAVKRLGRQIQKEEAEELDEAKCNMTEAGKMCEVHGMKACPKEEKNPSDEQPMYNGKKKKGKQLILDKDIQEREMTAAEKKKEKSLKDKYDDSDMKEKMMKQYGAEKGKQVYFAYIRKKAMSESISDQRSSKKTSSENAREKIYNAMERRKERKEKEKEKMKEQAAPTETPITLPVYSSTHGFDRI